MGAVCRKNVGGGFWEAGKVLLLFFFLICFLAASRDMWNLSSLPRDWTRAPEMEVQIPFSYNLFAYFWWCCLCCWVASLLLPWVGLLSGCGVQASHWVGFSSCGVHRLYGAGAKLSVACGLGSCGWRALQHRLSYSTACGIFLDQGWNPCLLPWEAGSLLLSHQGNQEVQILNHWISKEVPVMFCLHFGSGCTEVLTLC